MSIKNQLAVQIKQAAEADAQRKRAQQAKEARAIESFTPIASAMQSLKDELKDLDGVSINVNPNSVTIKLGSVTRLESSMHAFSMEFSVRERNDWGFPSYEVSERVHRFESSDQVIEFIIKKTAEHVAKQRGA